MLNRIEYDASKTGLRAIFKPWQETTLHTILENPQGLNRRETLQKVNHLLGEDPLYVSAVTGQIRHKYEDYANINLTYSRDRNAFIETNWLTPRRVRTLTITGTEGIINVEYTTQQITIENEERITQPLLPYREPLQEELRSFTDHIARGKEPEITGEDGYRALILCEAALQSSKTKQRIKVNNI